MAIELTKYYFWVGNVSGYVWACRPDYELHPKKGERLKYLGWTYDLGFPKKMNTGRLLHKPSAKDYRKKRKKRLS